MALNTRQDSMAGPQTATDKTQIDCAERKSIMKPFPHRYEVTATAEPARQAVLASRGLNPVISAPPAEFDGPGDVWSPETLLVGAVSDCFVLTFKAIAAAAKLQWTSLVCDAAGTLDRAEDAIRFTGIELHAKLELPHQVDADKARRLLEKAEKSCLVGNSLRFKPILHCDVVVEPELHPATI
jgi:peroxiredoxin-like protein